MAGIAPARTREVCGAGLRVSSENILNPIGWRTAQGFVKPLFQEVRKILNLRLGEVRTGHIALSGMAFTQERTQFISISVTQYDKGAKEVRSIIATPRLCAMTCDAFRKVCGFAAIRSRDIDGLFVARTRS